MAGKRQHFIPRFVQRGFLSQKEQTWVFDKTRGSYQTSIDNVGLQSYFYGKQSENNIDLEITKSEPKYAKLIEELRLKQGEISEYSTEASELMIHLSVRNKHIRQTFGNSAENIVNVMKNNLDTPQKINNMLMTYAKHNPSEIEKMVDESLKDYDIPEGIKTQVKSIFINNFENLINPLQSQAHRTTQEVFSVIENTFGQHIKTGHLTALEKTQDNSFDERKKQMKDLRWFVTKAKTHFILGDIGSWAFDENQECVPFIMGGKELSSIYTPLSKESCLVACNEPDSIIKDTNTINEISASMSFEFFISSTNNADVGKLKSKIRSKLDAFISDITNDFEDDFKNDYFSDA